MLKTNLGPFKLLEQTQHYLVFTLQFRNTHIQEYTTHQFNLVFS